jgi:ribosome-binding factor A
MDDKHKGRVEESIHQMIAELLIRRVKDPRVKFVSITGVELSKDYSVAKILYNIVGGNEDLDNVKNGLTSCRGFIRSKIKRKLRLRVIPELVFIYDSSLDRAMAIEELLQQIQDDDPSDEKVGGND